MDNAEAFKSMADLEKVQIKTKSREPLSQEQLSMIYSANESVIREARMPRYTLFNWHSIHGILQIAGMDGST
jgi:hypothetical protein